MNWKEKLRKMKNIYYTIIKYIYNKRTRFGVLCFFCIVSKTYGFRFPTFHDYPFQATHCATFERVTPAANRPWLAMLGRGERSKDFE